MIGIDAFTSRGLFQAREGLLTEAPSISDRTLPELFVQTRRDVLERQAGHATNIAPQWWRPGVGVPLSPPVVQ